MMYLNQAAAGLPPAACLQAIAQHLQAEAAQGPYTAAHSAQPQLQRLYQLLADLLHAAPDQLALTTGNSHGWNAVVGAVPWQAGDVVLVTPGEWGGNLAMLAQLEQRCGIHVRTVACDAQGQLDLGALRQQLTTQPRIRMLALTWIPAHGATIYPAEAVGALCAELGVTYVVDAAQALGHIPVNVQALQCDALTAPGRKWLCGPRGTGLLYVHPRLLAQLQPQVVDHRSCPINEMGAQRRTDTLVLEQAEHSVALRLGWGAALAEHEAAGWPSRWAAIARHAIALRAALHALPQVQLHDADASAAACGIVGWSVHGHTAVQVQQHLAAHGIQVAVHAMGFTPLDSQARGLGSVVRASVNAHTTLDEIAQLQTVLRQWLAPSAATLVSLA